MARRVDLSQKHNDDMFYANRNSRPFLFDNQELVNSNTNYMPEENVDNVDNAESNAVGTRQQTGDTGQAFSSNQAENENHNYEEMPNDEYEFNGDYYAPSKPSFRQRMAKSLNRGGNSLGSAVGMIGADSDEVKSEVKGAAVQIIKKNPIVRKVVLIAVIVFAIFVFLSFLIATMNESEKKKGLALGGYYALKCPEVTVIFVDKANGYEPIGSETFEFEEYVAGVIRGEVLSLHNIEIYKEFALLARTYAAGKIGDDCTIEASDRRQVFRKYEDNPAYSDMIYKAVEETKGKVILQNGDLLDVHYDAFCSIEVTDQYYTLKQQNQRIPRSWADGQPGIANSWKQGNCAGNHGMGVSTWGSYYLVTEQGYTYDEVLKYYLGDDITISTRGFMSAIDGLEIKDTVNATPLHTDLASALAAHGSSIQELDSYIHDSVVSNGSGTRAGVVTAAVTLINYLYDGLGVKIPYYWGGQYQRIGANPSFGAYTTPSSKGHVYAGLDCSGFVSWAILNGGYNFTRLDTNGFDARFSSDSCYMSDSDCIGQPGDLINSAGCHVQLIIAVDEASGIYYIAESSYGVTMTSVPMHSGRCGGSTKILHMDNFYNDPANINYDY